MVMITLMELMTYPKSMFVVAVAQMRLADANTKVRKRDLMIRIMVVLALLTIIVRIKTAPMQVRTLQLVHKATKLMTSCDK